MNITTTLTLKVESTNRTDDMLVTFDLVDKQTLFILKVLVTRLAVIMFGFFELVVLHLLDGPEDATTVTVGAAHPSI